MLTIIEDTGVGIPQNVKRNLFIAFRNATNEKKHQALSNSGIGIGLSNSKCLVNALGGKIDI
jgi:signal transduction histidine kinase